MFGSRRWWFCYTPEPRIGRVASGGDGHVAHVTITNNVGSTEERLAYEGHIIHMKLCSIPKSEFIQRFCKTKQQGSPGNAPAVDCHNLGRRHPLSLLNDPKIVY